MTQDQDNTAPPPADAEAAVTGVEAGAGAGEPEDKLAVLEAEVAKLKDHLLRALAETENVRRRLEQQAEDRGRYAISSFAKDVLPVADNLRRALDSAPAEQREGSQLFTGIELTERELLSVLERYGIRRIADLGERFDPHLHQAMMEIEDPSRPAGTVAMVMQPGYTIQDRLLRPAMVGVAKGGPRPQSGEGTERVDTTA